MFATIAVADNTGYAQPALPVNYHYAYEVQEDYAHLNFGQEEGRTGAATSGQYHVLLPDGRTQTVTYNVGDAYTGFIADVKYSGEAQEYKPAPAPAVAYKPAPAINYKPAPAYKPVVTYKPAPAYKPGK